MSKHPVIEVPSKDLVRKIRPAFAGVPDDSTFDEHLLIWSHHNGLQAGFIPDVPEALSYCGRVYHLQQPYIGDWDALLNPAGRLVGFSMIASEDQPIIRSDFLREHSEVVFSDGLLQILLCPDSAYEIECVQGIGTRLFLDSAGDYMFLFPKWFDWGEVGFRLETADIPVIF